MCPAPNYASDKILSAAAPLVSPVHSETFKECVALQAQYVFNRFGKFPGTVPSMVVTTYLQAHHLNLEFYDALLQAWRLPANPRRSHGAVAWIEVYGVR